MEEITFDMAKQALLDAITLRGEDYVYKKPEGESSCLYVHTDDEGVKSAGCGVGLALSLLGLPLTVIEGRNRLGWSTLRKELGIKVDFGADMLFEHFQRMQDNGRPWGYSYQAALKYAAIFTE